jgi:hypothetical protein
MRMSVTALSLTLAAMWPLSAAAQDVTCEEVSFDARITSAYPEARDACLEIVESDGVRYAHFEALVHREGFPSMLLRFKHSDDTWGPATLVRIPAGFPVYLEGRPVEAKDVPRGRQLDFYIPEGRWAVAVTDAGELSVSEAEFAPIEFEVVEMELPEEVDMEAPAMAQEEMVAMAAAEATDEGMAGDDEGVADASGADEQAAPMVQTDQEDGGTPDQSEWYWILGLVAAFIIVWFLLRRRKARRQG